jgi:hypothetical protein
MADADKDAVAGKGSLVTLSRPRGYFDLQRDTAGFDNLKPMPGVPATGAGISTSKIKFGEVPQRPISANFNGETITGRAWPASDNHISILEITY